jgi:hypothetical protein
VRKNRDLLCICTQKFKTNSLNQLSSSLAAKMSVASRRWTPESSSRGRQLFSKKVCRLVLRISLKREKGVRGNDLKSLFIRISTYIDREEFLFILYLQIIQEYDIMAKLT